MKAILNHPALYQAYQNAGGFSAPASRRSPIT